MNHIIIEPHFDSAKKKKTEQAKALTKRAECARDFLRVWRELDGLKQDEAQRIRNRSEMLKAAQQKREREQRINQLLSRIARLRMKMNSNGDQRLVAQISILQTQLLRLLLVL